MKTVKSQIEVHIRSKEPHRRDWNKKGVIYPGFEVEVVDEKTGEEIDGNDVWYQDKNGDFYWSGGFEDLPDTDTPKVNDFVDLAKLINLKTPIPTGNGASITIAILDSGIVEGHTFESHIIERKNFINDTIIENGHGTKVAGLIIGNDKVIKGLAPQANVRSYRVIRNNNAADSNAVLKALKYIDENNIDIDIVNLSLDIAPELLGSIGKIIDNLTARGVVVLAAGGRGNSLPNFITGIKNCICIGTFLKDDEKKIRKEHFISFVNQPIKSTSLNSGHIDFDDDSAYTALTSGLVARYLSSSNIPLKNRVQNTKNFLKNAAVVLSTPILMYKPYKNEN